MKNIFNNTEFLIITFTIVLLLLGLTIIYLFVFINKQKKEKLLLYQELDSIKREINK